MPERTFESFGRYKIQRVLGKGAMGVVYEGLDPKLNRKVAIKTILVGSLDEATARDYSKRFAREAQAVARLNHPNIVQVYDFGEEGEVAYIVMEYVRGRELKSSFDAGERFELGQAVRLMTELLGAMDFAHNAGVIHRDIKPANVMVDTDGHAKLADFGVARISDPESQTGATQAGTMVGTPAYMSPEQIQGQKIDRRTDIFSAGVILYQFLTGQRPFQGGGAWTMAKKIVHDDPPAPSSLIATVTPGYDQVVYRALAKQPDKRYQSAQQFADDLQRVLKGLTVQADPYEEQTDLRTIPSPVPLLTEEETQRSSEVELEFWRAIKDADDPEELELYLEEFPQGVYSDLARKKIATLRRTPAQAAKEEEQLRLKKKADEERAKREAQEAAQREAQARAKREAEEKARREAEEQARREAQAKAKREAEEKARREAEERARQEAKEKARREAVAKAKRDAEEKARLEALVRARREAEEKARREAEEKARREAEERARREAEEKARREADEKARREAEEKARREAEEEALRQAIAKAKREAEEKARREAEEKARREAEEKARREAEEKARREAEEKARREAEEKAWREAKEKARQEAEEKARREAEEKARREAEEKARREAEEKARREAEEKARREAEEKARREAEDKARREAEDKARREAEEKARREAEEKARIEAEARALREAEEQARRDAEELAQRKAEERARKEAELKARVEAEALARREAAAKARHDMHQMALREAEKKAVRAAEVARKRFARERALREAEERKVQEAEERARHEAHLRSVHEEQERQRLEAEAWSRREAAEAKRAAEATAARAAREKAQREHEAKVKLKVDALLKQQKQGATGTSAANEPDGGKAGVGAKIASKLFGAFGASKSAAPAPKSAYERALELEQSGQVADAVPLLKQAANEGTSAAATKLGQIYADGAQNVPPDPKQSVRWFAVARALEDDVSLGKRNG